MKQWTETFLMKGVRNKTPIIDHGSNKSGNNQCRPHSGRTEGKNSESFDVAPNVYLSRSQKDNEPDPAAAKPKVNALGIHEANLPEILQLLGIRSLTLRAMHDLGTLASLQC
jgi:hypothetical protein